MSCAIVLHIFLGGEGEWLKYFKKVYPQIFLYIFILLVKLLVLLIYHFKFIIFFYLVPILTIVISKDIKKHFFILFKQLMIEESMNVRNKPAHGIKLDNNGYCTYFKLCMIKLTFEQVKDDEKIWLVVFYVVI